MNAWIPGDQILLWSVNVVVQVGLVAGFALLIGTGFRQSAAARYSLLCTALVLVLLCPAFTAIIQASGRGLVSLPAESVTDANSYVADTRLNQTDDDVERPTETVRQRPDEDQQITIAGAPDPLPVALPVSGPSVATRPQPSSSAEAPANPVPLPWPMILRSVIAAGVIIWVCGVAFLLSQLIRSWWCLRRLLADARPNQDQALANMFQQTWDAMDGSNGRPVPELVFSDQVSGPVAAGLPTPKVILPNTIADTLDASELKNVLVHELAHIVRRDQQIVLLQNLTHTIFWLHPMIRLLNRRLAKSREEVCDNYVLSTTSAASYSRTLLTLAEQLQASCPMPGTVGLLNSHWKLEDRVSGLLDGTRNCVTQLSRSTFVAITLVCVAITVVITMGTASFATLSDAPDAEPLNTTSESTNDRPDDVVLVKGVVLLPDGSPASGATVRAAIRVYRPMERLVGKGFEPLVEETTADEQGRFIVTVHKQPFGDVDLEGTYLENAWQHTTIAASFGRYGCDWVRFDQVKDVEQVQLQLVEDRPIRGRVVDLEGQPLAGVSVTVVEVKAGANDDPKPWLDAVRIGETPNTAHRYLRPSTIPALAGLSTVTTTAADGTFEVQNAGVDRFVSLELTGEGRVKTPVMVLNRDIEPLAQKLFGNSTRTVFGSDSTMAMAPGRAVTGVVVDAETGQPLPGVSVEIDRTAGTGPAVRNLSPTVTDESGHFTLHGLPKAQPTHADGWRRFNELLLRPNDDQPYLMREVTVPAKPGLDPIDLTIELHRGIWITGTVTNKDTEAPVGGARVYYLPYRSNMYAQALPEFDEHGNVDGDETRYTTNEYGEFRLVGLPGPAVVGVWSVDRPFRFGVGYDQIDATRINEDNKHLLTYRSPAQPSPKWPNAILPIDPAEASDPIQLNFKLDPGNAVEVRFVDLNNNLVEGAFVQGLSTRNGYVDSTERRTYRVSNLGQDEERLLIVRHDERGIGKIVSVRAKQDQAGVLDVQLQPIATVTGVLTEKGQPLSGMTIRPDLQPHGDHVPSLTRWSTDGHGRFTGTLFPGCDYRLVTEDSGRELYAYVGDTLQAQPGQKIDLGTLRLMEDDKFVGEEPTITETSAETGER